SLYGWLMSHLGILWRISLQSSSARARRGSSGEASPGGGEGYITSQNRSARPLGSTDKSAWSKVVPERGSPVANSGFSILSSATAKRLRSPNSCNREVRSHKQTDAAAR